jgi:hypothetical protein
MNAYGTPIYGLLYDTSDDGKVNYDRIRFSYDKEHMIADLGQGEWSNWQNITLKWNQMNISSQVMFHPILIGDDGFFRIRLLFNNLNQYITQPGSAANHLTEDVGPMVDFVDNFPPQLIYYTEDKDTFLTEMNMSFAWHKRAIPYILDAYQPDVVVHDIYSPNQMLTSRWWLGYIDPKSARYDDVTPDEREALWNEVKGMYLELDAMHSDCALLGPRRSCAEQGRADQQPPGEERPPEVHHQQ